MAVIGGEAVLLYGLDSSGNPVPLLVGSDGSVSGGSSGGVSLGSTPSTQAFGDAAAGGSATTASKNDHKHGMPALGSDVIMAGTAAARPDAGTAGRLYYETDTGRLKRDTGAVWVIVSINSSVMAVQSGALGANVTITSAGVYVDAQSMVIPAGTWSFRGQCTIQTGLTDSSVACKLWDGTTVYCASEAGIANNKYVPLPIVADNIVLASSTTVKLSGTCNSVAAGTHAILKNGLMDTTLVATFWDAVPIG